MSFIENAGLAGRAARAWRRLRNYQQRFGTRATLQRVQAELQGRRQTPTSAGVHVAPSETRSARQWVQTRFNALEPLRTFLLPAQSRRRVSIVTDSIAQGSLFGGVGTALIMGTLLANRLGADLRIITRTEPPVPDNVDHVLSVYGIKLQLEMQFCFAPAGQTRQSIDLLPDETLLTTSWWTTAATLAAVPAERIVYLLQEDERMFYPFGDDHLRCEQVLRNGQIRTVLNTRLLRDHFAADGFDNLRDHALHFEPAFPAQVFRPQPKPAGARPRFVFYARPNNPRNLFCLGLEVIDDAVTQGILDPAVWDIVFVGKDIPDVLLGGEHAPQRRENLGWRDYAELIGGADLGLSLMYTPHPSYPPLDLVASGAVVVTNRHGIKQDLSRYSDNAICCDAHRAALLEGLKRGVTLALDTPQRSANHAATRVARDWNETLHDVIERLAGSH